MKSYKKIKEGILAEFDFSRGDNEDFWASHWGNSVVEQAHKKSEKGYLGSQKFILNTINNNDNVLEAGCGKGQVVSALDSLNINVVGVDFAKDIVQEINSYNPKLNVSVANLMDLPFKNNEFSIYLSFGVLEHFSNTKDVNKILSEAKRVTSRLIFIGVPHFSPAMKRKFKSLNQRTDSSDDFYQYYFDRHEIKNLLLDNGLEIKKIDYYSTYVGLKRHNKFFSFLYGNYFMRFFFIRIRGLLDLFFGKHYSHMIGLWVSQK